MSAAVESPPMAARTDTVADGKLGLEDLDQYRRSSTRASNSVLVTPSRRR
ncbi:MAG TPA: hypothetical protein VK988_04785 [Acidimicrobiales bacterium]|nr:hypothetical protein [Acidimicrobiales bacterium]